MPVVKCPVASCQYKSEDVEAIVVVALFSAHSIMHPANASTSKEKIKRPNLSTAGTSEDWEYFLTRWED